VAYNDVPLALVLQRLTDYSIYQNIKKINTHFPEPIAGDELQAWNDIYIKHLQDSKDSETMIKVPAVYYNFRLQWGMMHNKDALLNAMAA